MKSVVKCVPLSVISTAAIVLSVTMSVRLVMAQTTMDQHASVTPSFEVAAVKPTGSDSAGTHFGIAPERFSAKSATVKELIEFAYNVKTEDGIEGEPKWAGTEKFDVDAKIPDTEAETMQKLLPSQRLEQYRLMMQSLLRDRFGLAISIQTKQLPVYALVVAKNGPKLTLVEPRGQHMPGLSGGGRGELHASSVSMALFADWISGKSEIGGRAVIDQTGLKGTYDFTLTWTRMEGETATTSEPPTNQPATSGIPIDQQGEPLFTALQEQLGLRLEPAKGPVQVVVIESLEKPSPN